MRELRSRSLSRMCGSAAAKRFVFIVSLALSSIGAAPARANDVVGIPVFNLAAGKNITHSVGKCFAVQWYGGRMLLLMPLQLLSPEGGYARYIAPHEVSREIQNVDVRDVDKRVILATSSHPLLRNGQTVGHGSGDLSTDLMAFDLKAAGRMQVTRLAGALPPVGTRVWIHSKNPYIKSTGIEKYTGVVIKSQATGLEIQMQDCVAPFDSSGAPVFNASGEVIGMMVGINGSARTITYAAPAATIARRLYQELGAK